MEKRRYQINNRKICRFCLSQDGSILRNLYEKSRPNKKGVHFNFQILKCLAVEVFPSDGLPSYVCDYCRFFMEMSFIFKEMCRTADENVLHHVKKGEPLKPITYPGNLVKLFHSYHQSKAIVTEEGAFVQVTSEDQTESDDADEDVYNIKISNDPADGRATIEMVTDKNDVNIDKPVDPDSDMKIEVDISEGSSPETQLTCHQCNLVVGSEEEYDEHIKDHNMSADISNKCNICDKGFKSELLLKRHKMRMHPEATTSDDQINLFSEDNNLLKPQLLNKQLGSVILQCGQCLDTFKTVRSLRRHEKEIHAQDDTYGCQLCSKRFDSLQKATKHSLTHTLIKQCKNCDKILDDTASYDRHLSTCQSASESCEQLDASDEEAFQCVQCMQTFPTQDELIYHSAVHATETCVCPICHKKFANVDQVTVHIRSHDSPSMCNICNIAFTSNELCQAHIKEKHAEEDQTSSAAEMDDESKVSEEDEDDDDNMSVTEEGDHVVVQLKKPDEFMITMDDIPQLTTMPKGISINVEERSSSVSTTESTPMEVEPVRKPVITPVKSALPKPKSPVTEVKLNSKVELQLPQRASSEVATTAKAVIADKPKSNQVAVIAPVGKAIERQESTPTLGASDKSLKLLEKELQELKRTSTRSNGNADKTPIRTDVGRGRRSLIATSTPKSKSVVETKKLTVAYGTDKRRAAVSKENSEPKEVKELRSNSKEKEDNNKAAAAIEKPVEGVRRSRRSSKVKDYAKMALSVSSDESDEEFINLSPDTRVKARKSAGKPTRAPTPEAEPVSLATQLESNEEPAAPVNQTQKKRGRPRRDAASPKVEPTPPKKSKTVSSKKDNSNEKSSQEEHNNSVDNGQLPSTSITVNTPQEAVAGPSTPKLDSTPNRMQLGSKSVKVKKVLLKKAQLTEMMAKGLVEVLNGHVVLKPGIRIPDLAGAVGNNETPSKNETLTNKETPTNNESPSNNITPTHNETPTANNETQ